MTHRSPTRSKLRGHSKIKRKEQIGQEKRYKEDKREEDMWGSTALPPEANVGVLLLLLHCTFNMLHLCRR